MPFLPIVFGMFRTNWKPTLAITMFIFWSFTCYHHGKSVVRKQWDEANAAARAKVEQVKADNIVFNNVMKGHIYDWKRNLGLEYDDAINSVSEASNHLFVGGEPAGGVNAKTSNCGVHPERTRIARERIRIARIAKEQALTLIDLQKWQKNHPRVKCADE